MAHLTMAQIAGYAKAAGFTGEGLVRAVAVAWAESTGNTAAKNVSSDGTARGLWQISTWGHPEVKDEAAYDPARAAAATYRISVHGSNWSQWSTWPDEAGGFMGQARKAAGNPAAAPAGGAGGGGAADLPSPLDTFGWLGLLGKAGAGGVAADAAQGAALELVQAAAPVLLTVGLAGGALALVAVGLSQASKGGKGKGAESADH